MSSTARDAEPAERIAFLRMAAHPIPNRLLPPRLEAAFPGSRVEVVDLGARVRAEPTTWLVNPFYMLWEHGLNWLSGRISTRQAFFTTSFLFRRMGRVGRDFVERGGYAFSFQIQSLFDAGSPGTPHFVYTDHTHLTNLDYDGFDRRTLRGPRWRALERALYHRAAIVFTRSENVSRSLRDHYGCPPDRVVCVGAGSNARLPDRAVPRVADGEVPILFVGVDWERKGGPDLVAAFRRVRDRHPEARLLIVGSTPDLAEPGIEVIGRCPVEEIHRHYQRAAIFCLPSRREPFGVAYVEALHHSLPVVGTRIGAVPELVEEGVEGFLVDVGDVDALTDRLVRLVADPELRREMAGRAHIRARTRYTWDAVAGRMADSIHAALAHAGPSRRGLADASGRTSTSSAVSAAVIRPARATVASKTERMTS